MSVPFSSDEFLLKRSLFSSIFGVANRLKQAKTAATQSTAGAGQQSFDESRHPCSSSQVFGHSLRDQEREFVCLNDVVYDKASSPAAATTTHQTFAAYSPTAQLGQQFSEQLQFVGGREKEPQHNENNDKSGNNDKNTLSREQIYAEIVRECNALESQQKHQQHNNTNKDQQEEEEDQQMMMEMLMRSEKQEMVSNKFSCDDQQLIVGKGINFSLDLEKLIKVVVAHVLKEMKNNNYSTNMASEAIPTKPKRSKSLKRTECDEGTVTENQWENAEQILERKREQNNAAAARYRQRQKEQKDLLVKELSRLEEKNVQLKEAIANVQYEIDQAKAELWRRWHI